MGTIGTGTAITFSSGFFAEILDVSGPSVTREAINNSHMGTTIAHVFLPTDLVDWGELTVELAFDPTTAPPIKSAAETVVVTWPDATTWTFDGFMTGFEPSGVFEDRMTASATIKVTGDLTIA